MDDRGGIPHVLRAVLLYGRVVAGVAWEALMMHNGLATEVRPAHRHVCAWEGPAGGVRPGVAATTVAMVERRRGARSDMARGRCAACGGPTLS